MKMNITLLDSIIGFERKIKFIDNKEYIIEFSSGEIIQNGNYKIIQGKGMRKINGPGYGNLIIIFEIEPSNILSEKQDKILISKIFKQNITKCNEKLPKLKLTKYIQTVYESKPNNQQRQECVQQ